MKIFLVGATGAIGKRLGPLLTSSGHEVASMTRTAEKVAGLRTAGVEPVVADLLNEQAVQAAVLRIRPDVIVHQATDLAHMSNPKHFDKEFHETNRLRTYGTRYLLGAARKAGVHRFVAQSFTGWPNERVGGAIKTEQDPLDGNVPKQMQCTLAAIRQLEELVLKNSSPTGIVLRYGSFYGPGTSMGEGGEVIEAVRKRRFPIFGAGTGVWSFLHIDDAAAATALAVESGPAGVYNVVDDEPAPVRVWLPELARILGAKPPLHLPSWIGRLAIGEVGVSMMNHIRGSSNAKAKRVLGWQPYYASWREGFESGLSAVPARSFERMRHSAHI